MTIRGKETTVTSRHPLKPSKAERQKPAGICRLVIDEEEVPGISFPAYCCPVTTQRPASLCLAISAEFLTSSPTN
ncbi:hypothetical protein LGR54_17825 [Ancylobacter sp. Lp-2]|uniref:hypothetical protein n=1 Tax=Ancylobacter sp. Lp-2 TaxID=2881339 RepID=UPI001E2C97A8|nr:hypothetical protein [Ancylobacter sp. Lp-2]MCB4770471.1 hypothetical protein [Ancylobacter sp. Lp-2]